MPIDTTTLRLVHYPPERFVDATITNIGGNGGTISPTPLFLQTLYSRYGLVARLDGISTDQTAAVNLLTGVDEKQYPPNGALPIAQRPLSTPGAEAFTAKDTITLNEVNLATGTTANPVRADWGVWFWPPTIADKLVLGLPVSPAEAALWKRLAPSGYVPRLTPDILWEQEYAEPQILEFAGTIGVGTGSGAPVAGQASTIAQDTPPAGWFSVIAEIYVDASVGGTISLANQLANGLTVNIDRDREAKVDTYPAAGVPWSPWGSLLHGTGPRLVARDIGTVYLTTIQAVSGVPYRVRIHRYPEFEVHRARWGEKAGIPQDVLDLVAAGLA